LAVARTAGVGDAGEALRGELVHGTGTGAALAAAGELALAAEGRTAQDEVSGNAVAQGDWLEGRRCPGYWCMTALASAQTS